MRSVILLVAALGLLCPGLLPAQEKPAVQVEIVPPPLEGTVSIGVFDAKGKCVRVLAKNAAQDSLPAALNGWAISWDGKTTDGREAAAGNYEIRGCIVGNEVKADGVAWHFNDWLDPEHPEDAPTGIEDVELLPDGDFAVQFGSKWSVFTPDGSRRGISAHPERSKSGSAIAVKGNQTACFDGSKLWLWKGGEPEELPIHPDGEILDLTFGGESTLWWIAKTPEGRTLHSLNLADEKERELVPDDSSGTMSAISVSADDHTIALLNRDEQATTFRILRLIDQPPGEKSEPGQIISVWKTLLQRQITPCGEFGFTEKGGLIPQGKIDARQSLQIPLIENPLTPGMRTRLQIRLAAGDGGVWISTSDGLPLIPVAAGMVSSRMAIVDGGQPGSARVFLLQSVGVPDSILQPAAVAEYAITRLENMMTFTAGSVQWPPGPTLKPDENDVPKDLPVPSLP